jgi:hypothetical protein
MRNKFRLFILVAIKDPFRPQFDLILTSIYINIIAFGGFKFGTKMKNMSY